MSQLWQNITAPVGIWLRQNWIQSSEKSIQQYYQDLDRSGLSNGLVDVLENLVNGPEPLRDIFKRNAVADEDGLLYWSEDNFRKWVTANQPLELLAGLIPTLWRVFVYFAGFPFSEPMLSNPQGGKLEHQRINGDGFVQGLSLLALGGVEMLGNTKDGWTPNGTLEKRWSQKLPRLAALMFDGLKLASTKIEERELGSTSGDLAGHAEKQLMHAIALTQPAPYDTGLSFEPELREVAKRVLSENLAPSRDNVLSFAVSRKDLQSLIQLILLLRNEDAPWKRGVMLHQAIQLCGDIEKPVFLPTQEEIILSARLAEAMVQHTFGDVENISWQAFEAFFAAYPNIVLRFYHLWTAICIPPRTSTHSSTPPSSTPPNSISQFLSLLQPAEFSILLPSSHRFNEDSRLVQQDLQTATLVADSTSTRELSPSTLTQTLTNNERFHIIILSAEESHPTPTMDSKQRTECLFALFTSSLDMFIFHQHSKGGTRYSWRHGVVQLLPEMKISATGGLSAHLQDDGIVKFTPHSHRRGKGEGVVIDLEKSSVVVQWGGTSSARLRLKSLKCYQLPGRAVAFV